MSASKRRIVVTGVGVVTPLGTGNDAFWSSLKSGKSGVMKLQAFATDGNGTHVAGEVRDFDPKNYVKQRKSLKVMARDIQLAVGAAQIVVEDSGIESAQIDPTRFGVNCGAGLIATDLDELGGPIDHSVNGTRKFDLKKWGSEGMEQLFPLWMLKYLPNMPACHISITYNAQGPNNSITAGDASATLAMGEAYRVIARDSADVFIVGGTDSKIHPLSIVRLAALASVDETA
ncbi:MAG: beta-ketoacyl synthase N-terminal-like domain-containing protein [Planctomycetota bacterium]